MYRKNYNVSLSLPSKTSWWRLIKAFFRGTLKRVRWRQCLHHVHELPPLYGILGHCDSCGQSLRRTIRLCGGWWRKCPSGRLEWYELTTKQVHYLPVDIQREILPAPVQHPIYRKIPEFATPISNKIENIDRPLGRTEHSYKTAKQYLPTELVVQSIKSSVEEQIDKIEIEAIERGKEKILIRKTKKVPRTPWEITGIMSSRRRR